MEQLREGGRESKVSYLATVREGGRNLPGALVGVDVLDYSLVVIIVFHVGNVIFIFVYAVDEVSGIVDGANVPDIACAEGLRAGEATGSQPAIIVGLGLGLEIIAITYNHLLVSGITGKIIV